MDFRDLWSQRGAGHSGFYIPTSLSPLLYKTSDDAPFATVVQSVFGGIPAAPAFFSIGFLCGWLGDIFLIDTSGRYFLWGLGSFLVGHFFYIIGFRKIVKRDTLSLHLKFLSLSTTLIFFAGVAAFLAPAFQNSERKPLLLPVLFYCLVICVMAWYAWFSWRSQQGFLIWAFVGALLFVISDFCIALNFFVLPQGLPFPDLIILSTYGLAQAFIAQGTTALQPMN